MLGKPRIRLNNLKTSLIFPCFGLNPIIESINLNGQFLSSTSAVKVHDSQAYRNIGMTRERISFTFDPWVCFYRSRLASALLKLQWVVQSLRLKFERTSGLEPLSETTALRYMKLVQYPDSTLNLPQDAIGTVCHQSSLFSTHLHLISCAGFIETLN